MSLWQKQNFGPMLLKEVDKPFDSQDYLYELKFDGIRILTFVSPTHFKIISRNGLNLTSLFPELKNIQKQVTKPVIFDGEIVSFNDNNLPSFFKLQKRIRLKNKSKVTYYSKEEPVIFVAFDILYENKDLIKLPLIKRKEILNKYEDTEYFIKSKYILAKGRSLYKEIKKINLEGIIAKKINSSYQINVRTDDWVKIKNYQKDIFYVGGYQDNKSDFTITLLLGEYRNNLFYYVGKVTLGKKKAFYKDILKEKKENKSYFVDYQKEAS